MTNLNLARALRAAPETGDRSIESPEASSQVEEIVVSVHRREEDSQDVPIVHCVVGADVLKSTGTYALNDIQRLTLHGLGSLIMLIVGTAWIIVAVKVPPGDEIPNVIIAGCLTTLGFTWHVVTRIRISRYIQRLRIAGKARHFADVFLP